MAILRGFPPSNTISPTTYLPDVHGEAVVLSNRDPLRQGRVRLDFGSWAKPYATKPNGEFEAPTPGTRVKWYAYSSTKSFYYEAMQPSVKAM